MKNRSLNLSAVATMAMTLALAHFPPAYADESATEGELLQKIEESRRQFEETQNQIQLNQTNLDREFDRNGKLRQKLLTEYQQGCRSQEKIARLEMFVTGSHLADSDWDRSFGHAVKPNEGNPTQIDFSLGREVALVNPDEENTPIFTASGYLVSDQFENLSVADINMIRIKKAGKSFRADLSCWSIIGWTGWGFGKNCEYQNRETNLYRLNSLEIKINGNRFFSMKDIGFDFSGGNPVWQVSQLSQSTDYVNFMTAPVCKGGTAP